MEHTHPYAYASVEVKSSVCMITIRPSYNGLTLKIELAFPTVEIAFLIPTTLVPTERWNKFLSGANSLVTYTDDYRIRITREREHVEIFVTQHRQSSSMKFICDKNVFDAKLRSALGM